jgi:hypothetical protein
MRKCSLLLAVLLAASFSTVADAAKKKAATKAPADAAYEWNLKNAPPHKMTGPAAAAPAKEAKKSKKKSKKKA